jgi:hypothetical protein
MNDFRFGQNPASTSPYVPPQPIEPIPDSPGPIPRSNHVLYACICLHISSFLYVLVGIGFAFLLIGSVRADTGGDGAGLAVVIALSIFMAMLGVGIALCVEVVAWALRRRKKWGWIAGMVVFGIYIPSAFLPLGAIGMWALLQENVRREFKIS